MKTRKSSILKTKRLQYLKLRKKGGESMWTKTKRFGNKVTLKVQIMNVNKDIFFIKKKCNIFEYVVHKINEKIKKNVELHLKTDSFDFYLTNLLINAYKIAQILLKTLQKKYEEKDHLEALKSKLNNSTTYDENLQTKLFNEYEKKILDNIYVLQTEGLDKLEEYKNNEKKLKSPKIDNFLNKMFEDSDNDEGDS